MTERRLTAIPVHGQTGPQQTVAGEGDAEFVDGAESRLQKVGESMARLRSTVGVEPQGAHRISTDGEVVEP